MSISHEQAAEALQTIEDARGRALLAARYGYASPYLILWGLIWIVGFGIGAVMSRHAAGLVWPFLSLGGGLASFGYGWWVSRRMGPMGGERGRAVGRGAAALIVYAVLWLWLLEPRSYEVGNAFIVTIVMFGYVLVGLTGARFFLWLGLAVTALAVVAARIGGGTFDVAMALLGGGALLAGGIYLSRWRA